MSLGELIRDRRIERGWSQQDLADHLGVRAQTISTWELGQARPQRRFAREVADLLGVDEHEVLEGPGRHQLVVLRPDDVVDEPVTEDELRREVLRAINTQLSSGRKPTSEDHELFRLLLAAVGVAAEPVRPVRVHRSRLSGISTDDEGLRIAPPDGGR
jgi:transcriptional regulator with XRE-family HTH domain